MTTLIMKNQSLKHLPTRILAMRRGEKEGFLSLQIHPVEDEALTLLEALFVKGEKCCILSGERGSSG